MEENVTIFCKKDEYEILQSIIEQARKEYVELLNRETKKLKNFPLTIVVDTKYYLPDNVYFLII